MSDDGADDAFRDADDSGDGAEGVTERVKPLLVDLSREAVHVLCRDDADVRQEACCAVRDGGFVALVCGVVVGKKIRFGRRCLLIEFKHVFLELLRHGNRTAHFGLISVADDEVSFKLDIVLPQSANISHAQPREEADCEQRMQKFVCLLKYQVDFIDAERFMGFALVDERRDVCERILRDTRVFLEEFKDLPDCVALI